MAAADRKQNTGMDGAHIRMPSGRYTYDVTDLRAASIDEVAWLVARFMFSHADDNHRFAGSVGNAMREIWPGQENERWRKQVPRVLRAHGFEPYQDAANGRFCWIVPATFPAWTGAGSPSGDDGSQTTGGPVTVRQIKGPRETWTKTMVALALAIHEDPARHPAEYAERLGWPGHRVSLVGRTLKAHGYITAPGSTTAVRYYPTDKPLPAKVIRKRRRATPAPPAEAPPTETPPATVTALPVSTATNASVPFPQDAELATLGTILAWTKDLSPASRAWLVARLNAEVSP